MYDVLPDVPDIISAAGQSAAPLRPSSPHHSSCRPSLCYATCCGSPCVPKHSTLHQVPDQSFDLAQGNAGTSHPGCNWPLRGIIKGGDSRMEISPIPRGDEKLLGLVGRSCCRLGKPASASSPEDAPRLSLRVAESSPSRLSRRDNRDTCETSPRKPSERRRGDPEWPRPQKVCLIKGCEPASFDAHQFLKVIYATNGKEHADILPPQDSLAFP